MQTPETKTLVQSLRSNTCPACGATKQASNSFCRSCYFELDAGSRRALYRKVGEGYEQAMAGALNELGVLKPHWPKSPAATRETRDAHASR